MTCRSVVNVMISTNQVNGYSTSTNIPVRSFAYFKWKKIPMRGFSFPGFRLMSLQCNPVNFDFSRSKKKKEIENKRNLKVLIDRSYLVRPMATFYTKRPCIIVEAVCGSDD